MRTTTIFNCHYSMPHRPILHLLLVAITVWLLSACNSEATDKEEANPDELRKQMPATEVQVAIASRKPFDYRIPARGKVVAGQQAELLFDAGGLLVALSVQDGDRVQKGQLLARLENTEQALALEKARVALKERQLEYESQLLGVSHRQDSALQENLAYVSGLQAARVAYRQAKAAYEKTLLRAPFAGIVTDIAVSAGARVKAGDKLGSLFNPATLLVETEVLEAAAHNLRPGLPARFTPLADNEPLAGKVALINPRVSKHGTIAVKIKITDSHHLLPGMNGQVEIIVPQNNHIIIPESALVIRSGKEVVFVVNQGLAKWHYVTTGLKSNRQVEVLEGLQEGDTVIVNNNIYLAHDTPVVVVADSSAVND